MKVNFNNEQNIDINNKNLKAFIELTKSKITGNSEHLWLEYKMGKKSIEKKWHRFEYSDEELLKDVEKFIKLGIKK